MRLSYRMLLRLNFFLSLSISSPATPLPSKPSSSSMISLFYLSSTIYLSFISD